MKQIPALPRFIFASRWLQLPLYLGLIAAQGIYVYHFWVELIHLIEAAFGDQHALEMLVKSIGYKSAAIKDAAGDVVGYESIAKLNETILMLVVLLSFTLADRINTDRSLRINAQAVALAHAQKARASQKALIESALGEIGAYNPA